MKPLLRAVPRLVLAASLAALTYLAGIALMGLSAWLISRAAEHPDASSLSLAAVGVRALGLGRAVLRYAERVVGHSATLRVVADLRVGVFQGLVSRPAGVEQSGDVLSAVVADVDADQDLLLRCLLPFTAAALVVAVTTTASAVLLPQAGLVLLLGLGAALVVVPGVAFVVARSEAVLGQRRAAYQNLVLELLDGCADLLVLGQMPQAVADLDAAASELARIERRGAVRSAWASGLMTVLQGLTVVGVAAASLQAVQRGALPRVELAVLVLMALSAFEPVTPLAEAGGLLARVVASARRLAALLEQAETQPAAATRRGEGLVARDVSITYPGRDRPALSGLDLELRPGARIAVVGASGAGKSTLLQALSGQLRPGRGGVRCGGVEVADLDEVTRASCIVVAEQAAHVFNATVEDNVRLARPEATREELSQALSDAGLGGWFAALPAGWATPVGERGRRLSGGERKRLVVARALLSRAPVLLLDEPTEGLDPEAADALVRSLLSSAAGRALLLVTHRLVALEDFDEVLVLDDGRVVQRGLPAELAVRRGPFRELYCLQVPDVALVG